ncbi:hypothetical protein [Candidatus Hydrogenosomobacter endosymbioticus]|uniref:Uncharacterized protein n=1 Tax=Candidatus Hydrogenosomobacter endosymbioticus TaxID=2558174 RepID=A0ABN6L2T4_9PROT|nr:hypothetical protein [Candidatus Hydrogenosomobacter endosymbioticus]BDB96175.1 hypothetical protein HYD_3080 [Candidatus Hydrogenosomobacter endosymbioticus]
MQVFSTPNIVIRMYISYLFMVIVSMCILIVNESRFFAEAVIDCVVPEFSEEYIQSPELRNGAVFSDASLYKTWFRNKFNRNPEFESAGGEMFAMEFYRSRALTSLREEAKIRILVSFLDIAVFVFALVLHAFMYKRIRNSMVAEEVVGGVFDEYN